MYGNVEIVNQSESLFFNEQKGFCSLRWLNSTTESTNFAVLRYCEADLIYSLVDKWMRYMEASFFLCNLQVDTNNN